MTPGDVIVRDRCAFVILAVDGNTAAAAPVVSGYHGGRLGSNVALDPMRCGLSLRAPVADAARRRKITADGEWVGSVSPDTLGKILRAIARVAETERIGFRFTGLSPERGVSL